MQILSDESLAEFGQRMGASLLTLLVVLQNLLGEYNVTDKKAMLLYIEIMVVMDGGGVMTVMISDKSSRQLSIS